MAQASGMDCGSRDDLKLAMLHRLALTDAHFKHQQRGDPDLKPQEKADIALKILEKSSVLFLERFSQFLFLEDVKFFQEERKDYAVSFYLDQIEQRCRDTKHNVVKNRRFQALQELLQKGEYFSEEEMKWRDPLLYEQMVGQYCGDAEKEEKDQADIDRSDLRFSSILLKHMDTQATKQYYGVLKEREEEQLEESDEDSIEEDDEMEDDEKEDESEEITETERNHMRGEFVRFLQERFLAGGDGEFDYSQVDSNTEYDSLDILGHDAEERYFDHEDGDDVDTEKGRESSEHGAIEQDMGSSSMACDPCQANKSHNNPTLCSDPCEDVSQRLAHVDLDNTHQGERLAHIDLDSTLQGRSLSGAQSAVTKDSGLVLRSGGQESIEEVGDVPGEGVS